MGIDTHSVTFMCHVFYEFVRPRTSLVSRTMMILVASLTAAHLTSIALGAAMLTDSICRICNEDGVKKESMTSLMIPRYR